MKDTIKGLLLRKSSIYILIIAILSVLLYFAYTAKPETVYESKVTDFGLKNIGKLVTQEAYYTSVQTLSGSRVLLGITVPGTEKKYIYSYDGRVTAGIDFEKIDQEIDEENHTITVTLPEAEIFDVVPDLSSLTIYHEDDNFFNSLHLEEKNASDQEMEKELRAKALQYDILGHATENAKVLIRKFMSQTYDLNIWKITVQ